MFCHNCGTQVNESALFCPNCGEKLIADEIVQASIPQSYIIDTMQGEANQQVPPKKSSLKAVAAAAAAIIAIVILIFTGALNRIWDTLEYIGDVTDAKAAGAALEPAMKSASDMFPETQDASSSSSTNQSGNSYTKAADTSVKGPATLDDAMEIFESWEATHPLDPNLTVRPGYDDVENDAFTLFLWGYEAELGTIYVDKTDGSMKMVSDFIEYDLDDWYNGAPGENVYNSGDEYYIDGNFEWVEFPNIRTDYLYGTAMSSYIEGVVRNISGSTKSPTITFILYDSNWNQVGTAVDITSHLADGATWKFSAYYPSDAAYYEFYEID